MIVECYAALLIGFVNPSDPKTIYPSGIHDCDKDFINTPESRYPVLKIAVSLIDADGKIISPGLYEAKLAEKQIFLIQAGEVVGVFPVVVTRNLAKHISLSNAKASILDSEYVLIVFKENMTESHAIVRISR